MDYITIALLFIGLMFVNAAIGAAVFSYIDDDNRSIYKWYCKTPYCLEIVVLNFWPVGLYIWWINRQ